MSGGYALDMRYPRTRRIPRRRGAFTGIVIVLLGAFGALIPFVGPYFNFQIGTTSTWDWSSDRLWLSVLPGAAAVIGGLIMLYSTRRATASFGGLLALAGGLWFIAGPTTSMLWNDGVAATGAAIGDNGTRVLEWLGFYYAVGGLITLFAAYGLGFLAALPIEGEAVRDPVPATTAQPDGATNDAADPAPRRHRFIRRRGDQREREQVGPRA
jgi:hypothetical protein